MKTSPSVRDMPRRNRKKLREIEFRLGLVQVVLIMGLLGGSLLVAFYFGYQSGREFGYEEASVDTLSEIPRLAIEAGDDEEAISDEVSDRVYARLQELSKESPEAAEERVPPLGAVPTVEVKINEAEEEIAADTPHLKERVADKDEEKTKTLGGLLELSNGEPAEEAVQAKPTSTPVPIPTATPRPSPTPVPATPTPVPTESPRTPASTVRDTAPPKTIPIEGSVPRGWYAQVSAPQTPQEAKGLAGKLRENGFPVRIEQARVRGQQYFRVLVGPESSRVLVQRLAEQLKREPYLTSQPFIKLVR